MNQKSFQNYLKQAKDKIQSLEETSTENISTSPIIPIVPSISSTDSVMNTTKVLDNNMNTMLAYIQNAQQYTQNLTLVEKINQNRENKTIEHKNNIHLKNI